MKITKEFGKFNDKIYQIIFRFYPEKDINNYKSFLYRIKFLPKDFYILFDGYKNKMSTRFIISLYAIEFTFIYNKWM